MGERRPMKYNRDHTVARSTGFSGWLTLYKPRRSDYSHALGQGVRYRCERGLTACCRIFADMGSTWSERSSCRSHPERVIIATKHEAEKRQGLAMQTKNATGVI